MNGFQLKPYPKPVKGKKTGTGTGKPKPVSKPVSRISDKVLIFLLLKWSGIGAVAGSGKLNGTVMLKGGASGPSARVIAFPRNRRTVFQQLVRGVFSGLSTAFRSLDPEDIDAWNAAANNTNPTALRINVFGDTHVVTGSQLFQKVNNILYQIGATTYDTPPVSGTTDAILGAELTGDATGQGLDLDMTTFGGATAVPANTTLVVYATAQRNPSVSSFGKSAYRIIGYYPAAEAIPVDLSTEYIARFGALVAGKRIGVKAHFVFDDGAGTFSKGGDVYASGIIAT